jgi:hypothetical protein
MFETKTTIATRIADAVDLILDFATLGEYGLEAVAEPRRQCEGRGRGQAQRVPRRSPARATLR